MPLLAHLFSMFIAWCSWLFGFRHLKPNEIGNNKTVVIIGGGFGGLSLANYLYTSTKFNVILYDKKEYFEYTPSMLRVIARPSHMSRSHSRYIDLPLFDQSDRRVRFVQDEVDQINDNTIRTKSGDVVKFHKLVLAMGSDYFDHIKPDNSSLTLASRSEQVRSIHERVDSASIVNIFGAGLVGVELAAEIAHYWPKKKVILRSREPYLLPGYPSKAQSYALKWFRDRNVEVVLENSIPPSKYVCKDGEIAFNCTGLKPVPLDGIFHKSSSESSSSPSPSSSPKSKSKTRSPIQSHSNSKNVSSLSWDDCVEPRSQAIRISKELHLIGHDDIFAIGDIMIEDHLRNAPVSDRTPKVAYQAELQAWVVAENLKRQCEGRPEWKFPEDVALNDSCPSLVDCSLGPSNGLIIFNQIVLTGPLTVMNKEFLEISKMLFLRGWWIGEFIWSMVDPITLRVNRIYSHFDKTKGKKAE